MQYHFAVVQVTGNAHLVIEFVIDVLRAQQQHHGLTGIQIQMACTHPHLYILKTARKLLEVLWTALTGEET